MPTPELTEEEVFDNDIDPLEAIREIRREEGVPEEDLVIASENHASGVLETPDEDEIKKEEDAEELAEAKGETQTPASDDTESPEGVESADEKGEKVDDLSVEDQAAADTATAADAAIKAADEAADEAADVKAGNKKPAEKPAKDPEGEAGEAEAPAGLKFRANGQEFEFTQEEVLAQFETVFGQAANYTQKMQKIAPYRKMISALEQEGVTHENLNLALDALKGDKGAIKKLLADNKLDAYDLTSDEEKQDDYVPTNYGKDETSLDIEEITSKIRNDEEFAITQNVIDEQWDGESRQAIANNPNYITGLHNDIKAGIYDKVAPAAMKLKVLDGNVKKSDIEYYMIAGEQYRIALEAESKLTDGQKKVDDLNADAQSADSKFDKASSQAERKRSASSTGTRADRKGVIDYMDDNDEAYDEWYKTNVTDKM
jgi:predicted DNA-binding protein